MISPPDQLSWSHEALTAAGLNSSRDAQLWLESMGRDPADISDAELPSAIQSCRDQQELFSRKYGPDCLIVLPLSSGNIAVMSVDRQEYEIITPTDTDILQETILNCARRYGAKMRAQSLHVERLHSLGLDEPSPAAQARDLRRSSRPSVPRPPAAPLTSTEFSADDFAL